MRNRIAARLDRVSPSGIRKYFDMIAGLDGVISLGVGEPDFTTPWHITESAIRSLEQGYTMYTSNSGMPELREELARFLQAKYGVEYDPQTQILITSGVSEGLDLAVRAILDPGEEVLMPDPSYVAYPSCVLVAGGEPIYVPTVCDHDFQVQPEDIETRITPRTKALLLGYPSNPTGAIMERRNLEKVAEVAGRHNLMVISDEIYSLLTYDAEPVCFASIPGMKDNTIVLGGFSKAFAMTGWRIGYAAGSPDIIAAMTKIHQYTALCAPIMGQVAALEALLHGQEDAQKMVEEYDRRRRVIVKGLNELGLSCFEPRGAFYAFPSVTSTGLSSEEFAERLLKEEKVVVVPGCAFGASGEGHVRCCYATSMENIEEALERISIFVRKVRRSQSQNRRTTKP